MCWFSETVDFAFSLFWEAIGVSNCICSEVLIKRVKKWDSDTIERMKRGCVCVWWSTLGMEIVCVWVWMVMEGTEEVKSESDDDDVDAFWARGSARSSLISSSRSFEFPFDVGAFCRFDWKRNNSMKKSSLTKSYEWYCWFLKHNTKKTRIYREKSFWKNDEIMW